MRINQPLSRFYKSFDFKTKSQKTLSNFETYSTISSCDHRHFTHLPYNRGSINLII